MKKNNSNKSFKTLSERLSYALEKLNVTQAELARKIKIKPQAIHYLCNSKSKKSGFTYEIADALGINSLWLACGEGIMKIEDDPTIQLINSQKKIPLLEFNSIKNWIHNQQGEEIFAKIHKEYILTDANIKTNGFGFRLQDKSMYPRFDQNTIFIINPERAPKNNDFVLIYLKEMDDIIFRQLGIKDKNYLLNPINVKMYNTLIKSEEDLILGVMVEARWHN